ncbi:MAG: Xanthine and CO dehydrogenases maturation factor, XdhC/CoxF family [uncultured Pyrinomonadaceae bacterium]|uniref:Xanthine and CO dehydrogenases maturation factor, XdhC/CoxF family n=1 Tax=uncultured Pyrinomonadaceae bacterium TaxID=2283094 RepID=A0A6J4PM44_9BACT|nr:MAG: Xanthine and CO dehydrogenases maturation factor, XdhC/CoxF family [uncultured Pyrinomonadaceae bacterium]
MKEIQEILQRIQQFAPGEKAILATVVDVIGSGYRRPGARMLIDEDGFGIGTISGGCLEADVLERAKKVWQTDEPTVITYDTTKDENSLFGLGMGCRGIVRILLEPVEKESDLAKVFQTALERREPQLAATLISPTTEASIGTRFFYEQKQGFGNQNLPETFKSLSELSDDCRTLFAAQESSAVRSYQTQRETTEFFIEKINPPVNLLLFGAGYDALPLVDFAKILGWRVTAIDHRPAFANRERLPATDEIIAGSSEDLPNQLFEDENSVAVLMTHNYGRDREILRLLLHSECRYIGALGPKKRTEKLLAEIGENFSDEQMEKLHAPVGLDIGADSPEAIALSIVAEIQAILHGRAGGFLRERQGSIYNRNDD